MNNLMEYKGYHATVDYSVDDHALIGHVIGINDVLSFDADNVDELETIFHETIDDYLEMCAELGKDPDKEYKGSLNIRIGADLHRKADILAKSQGVSLNDLIKTAVKHEIEGKHNIQTIIVTMPEKRVENYVTGIKNGVSIDNYNQKEGMGEWKKSVFQHSAS